LARSGLPHAGFSTRLKSDSFVLQHYFGDGKPHAFWSDNWLLVYECVRQFRELLQDGDLIMTKEAALEALQIRLDNLGLARA
jgi:hypothetical protein